MRVSLEGWGRNHGEKVLFAKKLEPERYTPDGGPIDVDEFEITTIEMRKKGVDTTIVKIRFGIEGLRAGGDYQAKLRFSQEDIALLFALAFRNEPLDRVLDAVARAQAGITTAGEADEDGEPAQSA